jgi:hypothetical protein
VRGNGRGQTLDVLEVGVYGRHCCGGCARLVVAMRCDAQFVMAVGDG